MHELSLAEALVAECRRQAEAAGGRVRAVRVRRGGWLADDALRQGFDVVAAGTPAVAGAALVVEPNESVLCCPTCGHLGPLSSAEVLGRLHGCPQCGALRQIDQGSDLEVLEVVIDQA